MSQVNNVMKSVTDVLARKKTERHTGTVMIITRVNMQDGGVRSVSTESAAVMK